MLRSTSLFVTCLAAVLICAPSSSAGTLTLTLSSLDDLSALQVGQSATVQVSLEGLESNEELISLTTGVLFPSDLLGAPTGITAGTIVPDPLSDPFDFLSVGDIPGGADASFFTASELSAHHIVDNGVFYSFTFTPLAAGSGQIEFRPEFFVHVAEQFNPSPPDPIDSILRDVSVGAPLTFAVAQPTATAVPLPPAAPATLMLLSGIGAARLLRRTISGRISRQRA